MINVVEFETMRCADCSMALKFDIEKNSGDLVVYRCENCISEAYHRYSSFYRHKKDRKGRCVEMTPDGYCTHVEFQRESEFCIHPEGYGCCLCHCQCDSYPNKEKCMSEVCGNFRTDIEKYNRGEYDKRYSHIADLGYVWWKGTREKNGVEFSWNL